MKFSFTLFLRQIKPIVIFIVHLLALPRRFRIFMFINTNLYWVKFGYKSAAGIDYFSRDKDFGTKDWLLFPYYCFLKLATWIIITAYWLTLIFAPINFLASFWDSPFVIIILLFWIGFLNSLDQRLELTFLDEIMWEKIFKDKNNST